MFRRIRGIFLIIIIVLVIWVLFGDMSFTLNNFKSSKEVIVIDAGHGGKDPGTISSNGNYEKDINLEISNKLMKKLRSKGYKVISTRDSDEYVDNFERAELANKSEVRVFISIHCNAAENNKSVHGAQVLYYPDGENTIGNVNNNEFAQIIMNSMIDGTGVNDKGIVERKDLVVLNQTKMPAIIIECGFLSNVNEEQLLITDNYQNKMVNSITDGLEKYFSLNVKN